MSLSTVTVDIVVGFVCGLVVSHTRRRPRCDVEVLPLSMPDKEPRANKDECHTRDGPDSDTSNGAGGDASRGGSWRR